MNIERKNELLQKVGTMPTQTKAQKARKEKALFHLNNAGNDDGAFGKVEEILSKSNGSKAVNYSKQGKADCFVWIEENGKRKRYNAERKTNGGRIGSLRKANAPKYVVYSMDLCNSTTKGKRRVVEPKVMKTDYFLDLLDNLGATKMTNGDNNEEAIQPSNKGLYLAMLDYPVTYDPNESYFESDFDIE